MRKEWVSPICAALTKRYQGATVRLNASWKAIADEYGVGVRVGRDQLRLDDDDLDRLSNALALFSNVDNPLLIDRSADRLTLAAQTAQEKLSSAPAFTMARVAPSDGYINVLDIDGKDSHRLHAPEGIALMIPVSQLMLDVDAYQNIIIIENGAAFESWGQIVPLLPQDLRANTLFVYRGHGNEQRRLLDKIADLKGGTQLFFFGDYDPSGIDIAINTIAKGIKEKPLCIIAPANKSDITPKLSKPDIFLKQSKALERIKALPDTSQATLALMNHLGDNGFAVTQETLIAHKISLAVYPLN